MIDVYEYKANISKPIVYIKQTWFEPRTSIPTTVHNNTLTSIPRAPSNTPLRGPTTSGENDILLVCVNTILINEKHLYSNNWVSEYVHTNNKKKLLINLSGEKNDMIFWASLFFKIMPGIFEMKFDATSVRYCWSNRWFMQ